MAPTLLRRGSTIRFRITAIAALIAAVVLGASAATLVIVQRQQLTTNLDRSLELRTDQLIVAIDDDGARVVVANSNDEDRAAQLTTEDGTVLASTGNLEGLASIASPPPGTESQVARTVGALPFEDDPFRVLSRRVSVDGDPAVLHVAENIDDLNDAIRALTVALALTVPIVVIVMTGLVWWLVGRTLKPVEAIRAEVTAITGTDPGRRVTVPPHDDEISRLAATMNDMLDRLSEAGEGQRRFVADASHELRTPLTRIRTELEVDLEHPQRADWSSTHRLVLDEAIELQRLVDDLLYLARGDADAAIRHAEPLDLDDVVLREVRRLRARTEVAVDTRQISAAHVEGDRHQLNRVVRNLLDNAVRHAVSKVTVTLAESDSGARLRVIDDGPGIPPAARDAVFERFTRIDDARARTDGGSGLGLAISRDIAERHGGSLTIVDATVGTTFELRLP